MMLVTHDGEDTTMKHEESGGPDKNEYRCLIRATNGKHVNFSTHVCTLLILIISTADVPTRLMPMN